MTLDLSPEELIRKKIEKRFIPDERLLERREKLLANITQAIGRLSLLQQQEVLPPEINAHVVSGTEYLKQVSASLAEETNLQELQKRAEEVREYLDQAQELVQIGMQETGFPLQRDPSALTSRLDRIFRTIPYAFTLMQQEGITVSADLVEAFQAAQTQYDAFKPACASDPDECLTFTEVVASLEPIIASMKNTIDAAGRPDVIQMIEEMM